MPITGEVHIRNRGILYLWMTAAEMHLYGMGKYSRSLIAGKLSTGSIDMLGVIACTYKTFNDLTNIKGFMGLFVKGVGSTRSRHFKN